MTNQTNLATINQGSNINVNGRMMELSMASPSHPAHKYLMIPSSHQPLVAL